jgi:ubiquinol-cytochrome c reductase cytochrome b subunit
MQLLQKIKEILVTRLPLKARNRSAAGAVARESRYPRLRRRYFVKQRSSHSGAKLFAQRCATCHRYDGHDGTGVVPKDPQSASDLKGFASREWLSGLLDPTKVDTTNYFGATKFREKKMVGFVKKTVAKYSAEEKAHLSKVIAAVSAEAQLDTQAAIDKRDASLIEEGRTLLRSQTQCTDCHQFHKTDEDATGPDLTGYASRQWLINFISNPEHSGFYGERNDRMPAFVQSKY